LTPLTLFEPAGQVPTLLRVNPQLSGLAAGAV